MFVCTIGDDLEIETLSRGGEFICSMDIGHDDDTRYSLLVALSPVPGQPYDYLELIFAVLRITNEGEESLFDGQQTKAAIPEKVHRERILGALCALVQTLIDASQPSVVSMTTHTANLPKPALRKFHLVADIFRQRGWVAAQDSPYHGHRAWEMKRQS